jgi:c-di-GMP-binding flagellar brake protein YcgR
MDETNRRDSYRHHFTPNERPSVTLGSFESVAIITGQMINLSLGGMTVLLDRTQYEPGLEEQLSVQFSLGPAKPWLRFECSVIHIDRQEGKLLLGLQFLPLDDRLADNAREKVLWNFLLNEQQRHRKKLREGHSMDG